MPPAHPIPAERFWIRHALLPLLALVSLLFWLLVRRGDFVIADAWYALEGGTWLLKKAWVTETLIHLGGRDASVLAWLAVFATWLAAWRRPRLHAWRRPLGALALATATSVTLVSLLKKTTNMECAWDLQRYGGTHAFVAPWERRPPGAPDAGCFPAGHASAGYCWVALYFFFLATRPQYRGYALATALVGGGVFGVSQQLRGAHFLSHDVVALAICWFVALAVHAWGARRR